MMSLQTLVVVLIVAACSVYALWTLMPAVARRALAARLARLPWPAPAAAALQRAARSGGGCGCDGCDNAAPPARAVVTVHRRPR